MQRCVEASAGRSRSRNPSKLTVYENLLVAAHIRTRQKRSRGRSTCAIILERTELIFESQHAGGSAVAA
jgi:hypothetical protein